METTGWTKDLDDDQKTYVMDLIITTSTFSKDVLQSTVYNEVEKNTNKLIKQYKIEKGI